MGPWVSTGRVLDKYRPKTRRARDTAITTTCSVLLGVLCCYLFCSLPFHSVVFFVLCSSSRDVLLCYSWNSPLLLDSSDLFCVRLFVPVPALVCAVVFCSFLFGDVPLFRSALFCYVLFFSVLFCWSLYYVICLVRLFSSLLFHVFVVSCVLVLICFALFSCFLCGSVRLCSILFSSALFRPACSVCSCSVLFSVPLRSSAPCWFVTCFVTC